MKNCSRWPVSAHRLPRHERVSCTFHSVNNCPRVNRAACGASMCTVLLASCVCSGDSCGPGTQLADLELRQRRRARAEDRIRIAKEPG